MPGICQRMSRTVALLLICVATITVCRQAQSSTRSVTENDVKDPRDPIGGSTQGAPRLAVEGEFQSAPTLFRQGKFAEAERQFAWIAAVRKGTTWGERSQYYLAECQYQQKKYTEALQSFERLNTDYPATDYRDQFVRREYEIAQLSITWTKPKVRFAKNRGRLFHEEPPGANAEKLALRALDAVRHSDPTGPLADDATIQIADYHMFNCEYDVATAYYELFIAEYRKSLFCPHARLAAVEARLRIYLLNHRDATGLLIARELAALYLRAVLNFGSPNR